MAAHIPPTIVWRDTHLAGQCNFCDCDRVSVMEVNGCGLTVRFCIECVNAVVARLAG